MRIRSFLSVGVAVVGSLVVAACVGDAAPTATAAQGDLNGQCFANGTCNPGLSCGVVKGAAACVPASDASPADASPDADAANSGCSFTQTPFPCKENIPPTACYGATQTCAITGCAGSNDLSWNCFSPNQCGSTLACCLPAASASLSPGKNCSQGALAMLEGATAGANCASAPTCGAGDTQLCQFNSQCPDGKICTPIKIVSLVDGGPASLNGVTLGACAPP